MRTSQSNGPQSSYISQKAFRPAITRSVHQPKPNSIRLWTLQPLNVWYSLQEKGALLVDPTHLEFSGAEDEFKQPYDWMRYQMARRIPGYSGHFPWWAYEHFLDLRSYRWSRPAGERMVRLKLASPRESVPLSAYCSWHCVLGRDYLPASLVWEDYEPEEDAWKKEAIRNGIDVNGHDPLEEPWEMQLQNSWDRIFDVEERRPTETIQATFEVLRLNEVVKVTEFTPMCKR